MNKTMSKYFFYYPITIIKGEFLFLYKNEYSTFSKVSRSTQEKVQLSKLIKLIKFVTLNNEYYQSKFKYVDFKNIENKRLDHLLGLLPALSKTELIENRNSISKKRKIFSSQKTTGGSTGQPVTLYKNPSALARERVATWRSYLWAGIDIGDKQARFWGVPHSKKGKLLASLTDIFSNRKRYSAFNMSNDSLMKYYIDLKKFEPKYLYGYVSFLVSFTKFLQEHNLPKIPSVVSLISTSEVLGDTDRKTLEVYWDCKVFNEYGCGEVGSIAHECTEGNLHIVSDNLIVEIYNNAGYSRAGTGELVVTDLHNYSTPLIRYHLGDYGSISNANCVCGVSLPILDGIHGRAYDIIVTPEGVKMHPESVIYIFESLQQKTGFFQQFQVIQTDTNNLLLNLVLSEINNNADIHDEINKHIAEFISPNFIVNIEIVNSIPRENSGKLRVVKSLLNQLN